MSLRRRRKPPAAVHAGRLSGMAPHRHDPDERPTREDLAPQGSQIFRIPVPLPRFLRPRRER